MSMTVWNPFREMENMLDRYGRNSDLGLMKYDWSPSVDIKETDDTYHLKAEMPGVEKDDMKVEFDNGVLTIKGEKREEKKEGGDKDKVHRSECFYGSFSRSFTLPENVKEDDIKAQYKKGVLTLDIPKSREKPPERKKIEIK